MPLFLVDANLPQTFNLWQTIDFAYATRLNIDRSDAAIWNYAKENRMTILTRDVDFADRIIHVEPPPKVIHFKLGNIRFTDFRTFIIANWDKITFYNLNYKLVLVYPHAIEGIT